MFLLDTFTSKAPRGFGDDRVWVEFTIWYFANEQGDLYKYITDSTGLSKWIGWAPWIEWTPPEETECPVQQRYANTPFELLPEAWDHIQF